MSKLRVGDILIEDDGIRIAGQAYTRVPTTTPRQGSKGGASVGALAALRHFPVPAHILGWLGAGVSIIGFTLAVWGTAWEHPISALLRGGFLVPVGAGLIAAAVLKRLLEKNAISINRLALDEQGEPVADRVRKLLTRPDQNQTVEWLQERTGWPESTLVRVLAVLRERGELAEELNEDSGDFYYYTVRRVSRDLDSRLDEINRGRTQ